MEENDNTWHFNPIKDDKDSRKVKKNILISDLDMKQIKEYANTMPLEIGSSIYAGEKNAYKENDLVWRKLDHVYHGYNRENTKTHYKRTTHKESPEFLQGIIEKTKLQNASIGVIKLEPGNTIPWHYDSYIFTKNSIKEKKGKVFERQILLPFDWEWGHIYQIGNNVISNWKGGARYSWPNLRYHLATNAGIKDLIMITITGTKEK